MKTVTSETGEVRVVFALPERMALARASDLLTQFAYYSNCADASEAATTCRNILAVEHASRLFVAEGEEEGEETDNE